MSNVQVYEGMNQNQLLAMMGSTGGATQQQEDTGLLPLLKINYDEEDVNGNDIKKGLFVINGGTENAIFAKELKIRVLGDFMQYMDYDAEKEEVVNRSIIHRMGDEPIDANGTIRCGRPVGKELHAMSDDKKQAFASITCFRLLYGLISMEGTDVNGETKSIVELPCLFRTKGSSFMNFTNEVIEGCKAKGVEFQNVECMLSTQRHKKGSVTYFTGHFEPDFQNIKQLSEDDITAMKQILTMIKDHNDGIRESYDEALRSKQQQNASDAVDDSLAAEFEEVVDDELDF